MPRSEQSKQLRAADGQGLEGDFTALLRASLTAAGDDRSARVQAGLLRLLIDEGAASEVAGYLAPFPGGQPEFEVAVDESNAAEEKPTRTVKQFGTDIALAFTEAVRASTLGCAVEIVALEDDLRRYVLRNSFAKPGALEFVHPGEASIEGQSDKQGQAIQRWLDFAREADDAGAGELPAFPYGRASFGELSVGDLADAVREAVIGAVGEVSVEIDTDAVRLAVQEAFGEIEIELDADAIQDAVGTALAGAGSGASQKADLAEIRQDLAALGDRLQSLADTFAAASSEETASSEEATSPEPVEGVSKEDLAAAVEQITDLVTEAATAPSTPTAEPVSKEDLTAAVEKLSELVTRAPESAATQSEETVSKDDLTSAVEQIIGLITEVVVVPLPDPISRDDLTTAVEQIADIVNVGAAAGESSGAQLAAQVAQSIEAGLVHMESRIEEKLKALDSVPRPVARATKSTTGKPAAKRAAKQMTAETAETTEETPQDAAPNTSESATPDTLLS